MSKNNLNLDDTLKQIEKRFGKETTKKNIDILTIPTGSISLDKALGLGGIPRGRSIELYGRQQGGKSTIALSILKQAQLKGLNTAVIDAECSFDYDFAKKMGLKTTTEKPKNKETMIFQPNSAEDSLDIACLLCESGEIACIVIDSVAALVPQVEIESSMRDNTIALQARLISKFLRKITSIASKTNTCIIFINQVRDNISIGYGSPTQTPGGRALKFYSSVRIEIKRTGYIKKGDEIIGIESQAKVAKHKLAPPFRIGKFRIYFDSGLSETSDILYNAIELDIIKKSGSWLNYGEYFKLQGEEKVRQFLKDNEKVKNKIKKELLEKIN